MAAKGSRSFLLFLMDAIFLVAVLDVARIVVMFFGSLADTTVGQRYTDLTSYLVIPFGIEQLSTPFGGYFDVDTILTIVLLLILEGILGLSRKRV